LGRVKPAGVKDPNTFRSTLAGLSNTIGPSAQDQFRADHTLMTIEPLLTVTA
jgi:hypothetical protein